MHCKFLPSLIILTLIASLAAQEDPKTRKWYLNYIDGMELIKKGDYDQAIQLLEYAIAQKGKPEKSTKFYGVMRGSYIPYYWLGVAYYQQGRWDRAQYHFEKEKSFGEINGLPEGTELDRMLAEVNRKLAQGGPGPGPPPETPGQKDYEQALKLYTDGKMDEARPLLEKVRTGNGPYAADAGKLLQRIQAAQALDQEVQTLARAADEAFKKGDWQGALDKYQEIGRKKPEYPNLLDAMERCKANIRLAERLDRARGLAATEPGQAEQLLEEIRRDAPSFPGLDAVARQVAEAKRRKEQADRGAALAGYLTDGRKAFQEGNFERARRLFQDAEKLSPSSQQMGEIQTYLSRIEQQLEQSRRIGELLARGKQAIAAGHKEEAQQILQELLAAQPNHAEARTLLNLLQAGGGEGGGDFYRNLLKKGIKDFFLGNYAEAVANLKNFLSFTQDSGASGKMGGDKVSLARFFLGAAQISQYYVDRYQSPDALKEGRKNLQDARGDQSFQLPDSLRPLLSPKILQLFEGDSG
jgi:tetratricopeptide (TPR) repeat protein